MRIAKQDIFFFKIVDLTVDNYLRIYMPFSLLPTLHLH
jgi:hypothetical protein